MVFVSREVVVIAVVVAVVSFACFVVAKCVDGKIVVCCCVVGVFVTGDFVVTGFVGTFFVVVAFVIFIGGVGDGARMLVEVGEWVSVKNANISINQGIFYASKNCVPDSRKRGILFVE